MKDLFELYVETKIMNDEKVKEKYNVGKNQVLKVLKSRDCRKTLSKEALFESKRFDNDKVAKKFAKMLFEREDAFRT